MSVHWIEAQRKSIDRWGRLWKIAELGDRVSIRTSSRFQRSLGTYRASRREITVAEWLVDGPEELVREVLCHEAAHAAVHLTHGDGARPHGSEWRDLMARAGVPARVRIPASEVPASRQRSLSAARTWEHRCPVCQATRTGRTRVTRWRCRRCRESGLSGELVIRRVPGPVMVDG